MKNLNRKREQDEQHTIIISSHIFLILVLVLSYTSLIIMLFS
jgi:hypothetical protein